MRVFDFLDLHFQIKMGNHFGRYVNFPDIDQQLQQNIRESLF